MGRQMTPIGAVTRGLMAAAAGTAAMDLQQYASYRRGGGTTGFLQWEFDGPSDWDAVSAPARVGKRITDAWTGGDLAPRWARLTNNIMHWSFGIQWGAPYGIVAGSMDPPSMLLGPPFGTAVWLFGYAVLPLGGFYKPIWEYDAETLSTDLLSHLVYGVTTGITFRLLSSGE